jgi:hypothetical protein
MGDSIAPVLRDYRVCSANASPTPSASEDVFACAMLEVTAMTMPLSLRVISDITMPPASSPLTLPGFVASAKAHEIGRRGIERHPVRATGQVAHVHQSSSTAGIVVL